MSFEFVKILISEGKGIDTLIFLLLSAGPTLLWLFICLRFDRAAPEPPGQILKVFLWGVLITVPVIFIAGPLTGLAEASSLRDSIFLIFVLSFLIDGLFEELAKYAVLHLRVYRSRHFDQPRDGFVYGMTIGLGLAFVENILYGLVINNLAMGVTTVIMRGFTTTFMHWLAGGIIGYHLGLAKFYHTTKRGKWLVILRGLLLAILFHGFYNTIVRFGWTWGLIPLAVLLIGVFIMVLREIRKASQMSPPVPGVLSQ